MKKTWIFGSLAALVFCSTACDPGDDPQVGQEGATSGEASTGEDPPNETDPDVDPDPDPDPEDTEGSTGEPPEPMDTDSCSFLGCDDPTGPEPECSLWAQDCGDGEKCMPWANDGGSAWNAARCSPIDSAPGQPGDPCTVEGSGVSGVDSCDVSAMCWGVDEQNNGTCVSLCQGTEGSPLCDDPEATCIIANDGFLPLCLPSCDPLLQNCTDGEACYPSENGFVCAPDASGPDQGAYGDACAYTNACDPSLICAGAAAVPGCDSANCCTHFCDLADPEPSADCGGVAEGQECLSFFAEGMALPGFEDVGFCTLPE
jgi:hypothetical protein